jgi:TPR repeat protein
LQKKELYKQAFDLYEQLSIEKKNANAFSNMGHLYCLGLGVPQDYIKAMKCYRSAVEGMNVAALTKMGVLYQVGLGVPQNYDKAMTCYKTAAERGSYEAFFNLGLLYRHGLGVPQNERQAIVCFNNAVAFEVLIEPDGVDEFVQTKLTEALTYLEKEHYAAALTEFLFLVQINHPEALFQIGMMCLKGLGVQQSETNAVKYLIEADENNHPKAALMLGDSYLMNSAPERLNKALTLLEQKKYSTALNQFLLLAQINHPEALFQLGLMYMKGLGVKQSDTNTVKYLTQAHENNHLKAAFMIGESYMRRSIFRRETPQALIWYKKASDAGNGEASYRIAELLIEANDRDYAEKIRHYLHLAISQGQLNAQKKLTKWESQYSWHLSFVDLVVEKEPLGLKGDEMEDEKL